MYHPTKQYIYTAPALVTVGLSLLLHSCLITEAAVPTLLDLT